MPVNINFPNFMNAQTSEDPNRRIMDDIAKAYMVGRLPAKNRLEEEASQLANALQGYNVEQKAIEQPYLSDKYRLENELTKAQFEQALADAEHKRRFGQLNALSGFAKDAQSTYLLEQMFGPDHPVVQEAKRRTHLDEDRIRQNMENTESLIGVRPRNALTQFGKGIREQREINQGYYPGAELGGEPINLSEEEQKRFGNQYELKRLKDTSDPYSRRAVEQSRNIDTIIKGIDANDLTRFSGINGRVKLAEEQIKDQQGHPSKDYLKYLESQTAAFALAKAVRQQMQDSVTANAQNAIQHITNPSSLGKSPEAAKAQYDHYIKILKNESANFARSLQDPTLFYGNEEEQAYPPDGITIPTSEVQPNISGKVVAIKNKRTGQIEMVSEEEAKRRGAIR